MSAIYFKVPDWHAEAKCRSLPFSQIDRLFFPEHGGPVLPEARQICGRCPVQDECLEAGRREAGVWGGVGENERTSAA